MVIRWPVVPEMFVLKMIKNEYLFFQVTIDVFFSGHGVLTSFLYYTLVT